LKTWGAVPDGCELDTPSSWLPMRLASKTTSNGSAPTAALDRPLAEASPQIGSVPRRCLAMEGAGQFRTSVDIRCSLTNALRSLRDLLRMTIVFIMPPRSVRHPRPPAALGQAARSALGGPRERGSKRYRIVPQEALASARFQALCLIDCFGRRASEEIDQRLCLDRVLARRRDRGEEDQVRALQFGRQ